VFHPGEKGSTLFVADAIINPRIEDFFFPLFEGGHFTVQQPSNRIILSGFRMTSIIVRYPTIRWKGRVYDAACGSICVSDAGQGPTP
jgi:hypothetical protein